MQKEGNFGYREAISMMVITIVIKSFFSSPTAETKLVGTASWYMTLISALTASFLFIFQYLLIKRFPNLSIMEISDNVLGKVFGSISSLSVGAFFIFTASIDMREFVEVMKIFVLPESPPSFIMVIFTLSVVALSFMGLETIARFSRFIVYVLGAGFLTVIFMSFSNFEAYRMYPILGYGINKTIIAGFVRSSFYGTVTVLGVFAASLQGPNEFRRIGFTSIFISGIVASVTALSFTLTFSYTVGHEIISPMYALTSMVDLGGFFQRIEPLFLFLWNFGTFIEVTVLFYAAVMIYCHVFKISDKRPVILPMTILMYGISLIPDSLNQTINLWVPFLREWGWIFYFLPSILVFIVSIIRKKKGGEKNA
ncbi:MAG: GerAB/ArcD/ProY family transporter [Clostridiaceae bacterium]|nr:GerAB/ArcD/ProY family transporter [Clostridiaceae bacterium]